MEDQRHSGTDHDLLIRMDENVRNLRQDVTLLSTGIGKKLDDHETRIRRLEKYVWSAIGVLAFAQLMMSVAT